MGDRERLKSTLKEVSVLYIVTPSVENRVQLVTATAEVAKEAGVKFVLVVSGVMANLTDTIIGAQFSEIEDEVGKLGVPYTFLRLPFFVENLWGFKDSITGQGAIYCPVDPDKPYEAVVVEDAGKAGRPFLLTHPNTLEGHTPSSAIATLTMTLLKVSLKCLAKKSSTTVSPTRLLSKRSLVWGCKSGRWMAFFKLSSSLTRNQPSRFI